MEKKKERRGKSPHENEQEEQGTRRGRGDSDKFPVEVYESRRLSTGSSAI